MKIFSTAFKAIMIAIFVFSGLNAFAEKRVALIVGNQNYYDSDFENLPTCINDANEINRVLTTLGFSTILVPDGTKEDMLDALERFSRECKNADVAVYFFSGHATRLGQDLYMVPSKTKFRTSSLSDQLLKVSNVRDMMENNSKLSLLFLDACRDGATTDTGKTKSRRTPTNVGSQNPNSSEASGCMVFYATQDGRTATVGNGNLSPFTRVLASHLTDGEEFRTVWQNIKNEVSVDVPSQRPSAEDSYTNSFYFNKGGRQRVAPETTVAPSTDKRTITLISNVPNAFFDFYGKKYKSGTRLTFDLGSTYVYTLEAEGYETVNGKIVVSKETPQEISVSMKKIEPCNLKITCNTNASVYLDDKYVGVTRGHQLSIKTTTGKHSIKLSANGYYSYTSDINLSESKSINIPLDKKIGEYWEWDGYDGQQSIRYHFSPKYQIGLSYMYKPEETRFSFGLFLAASPGWFKGLSIVDVTSSVYVGTSTTITVDDGNGNPIVYKSTTTQEEPERYSPEIDPNNEAKKYEANSMALANVGFNITNGISVEAGFGVAYHQDRYYMSNVNYLRTTTLTNEATGEIVGEPKIECVPQGFSQWFKQDTKWSPALRLGANGLIPLDGWDKYFISFGAGYTFLFTNNKFSSWDANIGFVWKF